MAGFRKNIEVIYNGISIKNKKIINKKKFYKEKFSRNFWTYRTKKGTSYIDIIMENSSKKIAKYKSLYSG